MSERRAVILMFAATMFVTTSVAAALMAMHVDGSLIAVASMVVGGLGIHALSMVIVRYEPPEQRRR
jgi:uncharacterized membrane protein YhiD involved in acid resistance